MLHLYVVVCILCYIVIPSTNMSVKYSECVLLHTHAHTHTRIYTHTYIHMYVRMYVYMYVWIT